MHIYFANKIKYKLKFLEFWSLLTMFIQFWGLNTKFSFQLGPKTSLEPFKST